MVPPNWDSWSKIRVLRDGFDVEKVNEGWSIDVDQVYPPTTVNGAVVASNGTVPALAPNKVEDQEGSTVVMYETEIRDPSFDTQLLASQADNAAKYEPTMDTQEFLAEQQKMLDKLKQMAESEGDDSRRPKDDEISGETEITGKIGPVRINMGGIQADADDMVQRLKASFPIIFFFGNTIASSVY